MIVKTGVRRGFVGIAETREDTVSDKMFYMRCSLELILCTADEPKDAVELLSEDWQKVEHDLCLL